jgi:aminopeptidase
MPAGRHGATTLGDPYLPAIGNGGYAVEHYDLDLEYRVASNRLEAVATVTAAATQDLDRFSFDLIGLRATRVTVDGVRASRFTQPARKLVITPAVPIKSGAVFTVVVRYQGSPRPARSAWGELGWEELSNGVLVAGQPSGAATWFPCNDHPSAKASYRIQITTDSPYAVITNGEPVSHKTKASTTTWVWEQREPMSTYLATVQIGDYAHERVTSGPIEHHLYFPANLKPKVRNDFADLPRMMKLFIKRFGPYPFRGYRVVVTDDELEIPLEAQGMAIFGRNHVDGAHGHERLIAHELAHQWFGNSVTANRWKHIWLHEGFACYAEWLWAEENGGPSATASARSHWRGLSGLPQDLVIADPGPELMFDDRVYKRGALALHALRHEVGDKVFFEILRDWTKTFRHALVTTDDFVALAARHAGGKRSIPALFEAWVERKRLPLFPG